MSTKTFLVTGATGKQGGALVSVLLEERNKHNDIIIRALTRNPDSAASQSLKSQGVEIFKGDLSNVASLVPALKGADAAFLVTDPSKGMENEVQQGSNFIQAAQEVKLPHAVFTSVASADTADVPHFQSKHQIEEKFKSSGLQWTFLRPVAFFDNIPHTGFARFGALSFFNSLIGPDLKLQWISCKDIGKVASQALLNPAKHYGQTIDLASDTLSLTDIQNAFGKVTGPTPWKLRFPQFLVMKMLPFDFQQMVRFWHEENFSVDVQNFNKNYKGVVGDVHDWIRDGLPQDSKTD
ncbi:unnamed protein product [Sympodiomycopsis kandeliae]